MSDTASASPVRPALDDHRWDGVDRLAYKEEAKDGGPPPFRAITRQVLFSEPALEAELRYFEMQAGGHSTLERHEHMHAVMILRGHGHCLVGSTVTAVKPHDLVTVPAMAWHQFRADAGEPMGFLCMVNRERDRPQLPTRDELEALRADAAVAAFLAD